MLLIFNVFNLKIYFDQTYQLKYSEVERSTIFFALPCAGPLNHILQKLLLKLIKNQPNVLKQLLALNNLHQAFNIFDHKIISMS